MVGKCRAKPDRHTGTAQPCTILSILCWLHHEAVVTHGPRKSKGEASCPGWQWGHGHSPSFQPTAYSGSCPWLICTSCPFPEAGGLVVPVSPITLQSLRKSSCCSPCNLSPSPGTDMLCFCPPAVFSPAAKTWWTQGKHGGNRPHPLISGFSHFPRHLTSTSPAPQSRRGLTRAAPTKPYQEQKPKGHWP